MARNVTSIQQEVRIHIKLDTGMHRLGFGDDDLETLQRRLSANPGFRVQSVFSHLASSEDACDDDFTLLQITRFEEMSQRILAAVDYPVLRHILNSAGIYRFPQAQFDMVRLGIGLYGVGSNPAEQARLRNVSAMKSVITQVKHITAGDTVGYNRKGKAETDRIIAIVPVGYADGLNRRLGNGKGKLWVNGQPAPIIGNICMDLTMIDITNITPPNPASSIQHPASSIQYPASSIQYPVSSIQYPASSIQYPASSIPHPPSEGSEVVIFNEDHPVTELAETLGTIPYEVLTGISRRVKRIYYYE
jgi:alanine racemase